MEGEDNGRNVGISYRAVQKLFNLLHDKINKQVAGKNVQQTSFIGVKSVIPDNELEVILKEPISVFKFSMTVSMLEIYNDDVHDLLTVPDYKLHKDVRKRGLDIRRCNDGRICVPCLTKAPVECIGDVMYLLRKGNEQRATACTNSNEHSSRSHMILNVEVTCGFKGETTRTGNLYLVDLAGSERVKKSAVIGPELKEAGYINKSLAALGNVMEALDKKASHVPYRDSKLTFLLQNSLGENSRTMMVVTVCPCGDSYDESQHALQFATRVKRIHLGTAKKNVSAKNLEETVKKLSSELKILAKAKDRSDDQLLSLRRDHKRLQQRLKKSSESHRCSNNETIAITRQRKNNRDITMHWQKEKCMRDLVTAHMESAHNEVKGIEEQYEKEYTRKELLSDNDSTSSANLKAHKAQILQDKNKAVGSLTAMPLPSHPTTAGAGIKRGPSLLMSKLDKPYSNKKGTNNTGVRSNVLNIWLENDTTKVNNIDSTIERFVRCESHHIEKMTDRYQNGGTNYIPDQTSQLRKHLTNTVQIRSGKTIKGKCYNNEGSIISDISSASREKQSATMRSERAMAKHLERIRRMNTVAGS